REHLERVAVGEARGRGRPLARVLARAGPVPFAGAPVDVVQRPPAGGEDVGPVGLGRPPVAGAVTLNLDSRSRLRLGGLAVTDELEQPLGRWDRLVALALVPLVGPSVRVHARRGDDLAAVAAHVQAGAEAGAGVVADHPAVAGPGEDQVVAPGAGDRGQ